MPMYTIDATVRMQCRGPGNRFLPVETRQYSYNFDLSSPDDDYTDELFAFLAGDLPDGCRVVGSISTLISPAAFAPPPGEIGDAGDISTPTVDDIGQLVTIYAVAIFDCHDGYLDYRTVRVDVPVTATRDQLLDSIRGAVAQMILHGVNPVYECTYVSFRITAPAMYQYLTE